MITLAAAPAAPPSTIWQQAQSAVAGILTLDPAQAAIRGGLTLLVFFGASLLLWGLHLLLKGMTDRLAPADGAAPPQRRLRIGHWSLRIARLIIAVIALVAVLRVWGVDIADLAKGPVGAALAVAGRIALIIALALAAMEMTQLAITQVFTRVAQRAKTMRRASQLRTLAPVLIGVCSTTIVVVAAMMSLSEIGVEIGPLLAGAGIVGLAVGFGAQTIVKDFLTGIFLIIEDTVSIGDTVRIGESTGTVEEMSLRTIKLRAFDGTLHVFPYSEAQVIHNQTKDFSYYVFEILISNSADIGRALDLMQNTGGEVEKDQSLAGFVLAPVEIAGVDKISDAGILLKARIKTMPGRQYKVGREFLRRIKLAFDANHIETPAPSLKLLVADRPITPES